MVAPLRLMRETGRGLAAGIALAVVAVLAVAPAAAREPGPGGGIVGADDRHALDSAAWPWRAIGRVNVAGRRHCTGTLVGPRQMLTAAHCLVHPRLGRIVPHTIHFLAGYRRGAYLAHATATRVVTGSDASALPDDPSGDWAIVTLEGEVAGIDPVPVAPAAGTVAVTRAGYGRDRAHLLTVDAGCHLAASPPGARLARHDCDAVPGDSGSPLLAGEGAGVHLVALNIGYARSGGVSPGIAIAPAAFVGALRAGGDTVGETARRDEEPR